ncbi:MAG: type III-A CRISPR-associated RAMP protein Csm3 [Deltaproteobacteria bacterium]|nr:type III-A CRISPR-associated RAMP protein Csm3 [Deltaproteobacteria bacterium]
MKLLTIKEIKGKITLKSGLHIGAGDMEMKIGGTDNPVIKHPHTLEPFIPGSSLKGKVRSLLEMRSGLMKKSGGKPLSPSHLEKCNDEEKKEGKKILRLFGASGADDEYLEELGPTRISFADAFLNEKWKKKATENQWSLIEVKSENTIDRIKGTAEHPRFIEHVPSGVEFDFCVALKIMENDEGLENFLIDGLRLLQMDALGGSGSRGYGKIEFKFDDSEIQKKFDQETSR